MVERQEERGWGLSSPSSSWWLYPFKPSASMALAHIRPHANGLLHCPFSEGGARRSQRVQALAEGCQRPCRFPQPMPGGGPLTGIPSPVRPLMEGEVFSLQDLMNTMLRLVREGYHMNQHFFVVFCLKDLLQIGGYSIVMGV